MPFEIRRHVKYQKYHIRHILTYRHEPGDMLKLAEIVKSGLEFVP